MKIPCFNSKKVSFSQSGEDLIVKRTLSKIGIKNPTYLEIGTNDPVLNNNTYLFYINGSRGVLVEPDPIFFKKIKRKRKKDVLLNCGVGISNEKNADFYIISNNSLNTFSKEEAEKIKSFGKDKIIKTINTPLISINEIIKKYFPNYPNFISIDVEGLDFEILKSINFNIYRPEVFCIETITFTQDNTELKREEIFKYMDQIGYMNFADTYINTIFVDKKKWLTR